MASALPADTWRFVGFLPRKRSELEAVLRSPETLVAFESPRRLAATLEVAAALDPGRRAAVCRELTKVHEEVVRGTVAELAARYARDRGTRRGRARRRGAPRGRGRARRGGRRRCGALVDAGAQPRAAATVVAKLTGASANALYEALTS